jgi:uncharacterized protein YmfQ (DUF2313 family)
MARDFNAYTKLLKSLLPRGRAWNRDSAVLEQLLIGKAVELARVDARVDDLINERDTRTTIELLPEYELDYGLSAGSLSTAQRQAACTTKLRALGSLMKSYYISLAAQLGYTVTIEEFTPAWAGIWTAGQPCGDQQNLFYWRVDIAYTVSDTPAFVLIDNLVELFEAIKPAHTTIIYQLYGPGFSNGFSTGFIAMPSLNQSMGGFNIGFSYGFDMVPTGALDGGFNTDFSSGFQVCYGGGFSAPGFDFGFNKVYDAFPYNGGGFDNISFGNGFDKRIQF